MAAPLSPYAVPRLYCQKCGKEMREKISRQRNGQIQAVTFFCDAEGCRYGFELSLAHAYGQIAKYEAKPQWPRDAVTAARP